MFGPYTAFKLGSFGPLLNMDFLWSVPWVQGFLVNPLLTNHHWKLVCSFPSLYAHETCIARHTKALVADGQADLSIKRCCEVGLWRPHKLRLFSPLLTFLFHEHSHRVFGVLLYAISKFCDTDFAGQVVYKPWVLSVSSEAPMPITAILIPAADWVLLLHQLVIGPVTVHLI